MTEGCNRRFDEELLSGYADAALSQGDEQRVRVHLEDCAICSDRVREIHTLREATMGSEFEVPQDDQWKETPRTGGSAFSSSLGWLLVAVWAVASTAYGLFEYARSGEDLVWKLLAFAGLGGFALLLVSVALDRLKTWKTDRYTEVEK